MHTGLMRREFHKPAGHRALSTGSVRCSPDPCAERVAKRPHTGRTGLRPVPVVRCLTLAGPGTVCTGRSDAASGAPEASVRCVFSQRETLPRLHQISHRRNRKYALHFLKKRRILPRKLGGRERGTHPLSNLQTPPPSQSVPTPQRVYQQVNVC